MRKIGKEIITFGNIDIKKLKLLYHKNPILIDDIDIDKMLIDSVFKKDKYYHAQVFLEECKLDC